MNVESFEPYHIGTKLIPDIDLNIFLEKITKVIEQNEYEVPKEPISNIQIIGSPTKIIGVKNDVRIELNFAAQALNVIGRNPSDVFDIFEEVQDLLPSIGYEIDATVLFYEIISTIIIKTDKDPVELLKKSTRLDFTAFEDIYDLGVIGLRISNMEKNNILFNLIIEPNKTSPNSRFSVQLQFRSKEKEKIQFINNELENKILSIIQSLERDE